jgi:hypothetical protein
VHRLLKEFVVYLYQMKNSFISWCVVTGFSIELTVPGSVVSSRAQVEQMHHILDVPIATHPRRDLFWHTVFSNVYD